MIQDYKAYSIEDHKVWSLLYYHQMEILPQLSAPEYLEGIHKCGFVKDSVPNFSEVNKALDSATGWSIYVVPGLIDNRAFFEHLSRKEFPATTWLRSLAQLNYLEEPDMFHDVFGHIPLLSEQFFCDYLQRLSDLSLDHIDNPTIIEYLARLYWYTVEFGLIRTDRGVKIYGAGILSSAGESVFSLSADAHHIDFDPIRIMNTPYIKDKYQAQYFVIDSFEELFDSLKEVREFVANQSAHYKRAS
ncbi:MAG: phenylalanine-4-hydroxylase [Saprospiraceae bacterium]|jgi:phenylalanine-4-hydroxylase